MAAYLIKRGSKHEPEIKKLEGSRLIVCTIFFLCFSMTFQLTFEVAAVHRLAPASCIAHPALASSPFVASQVDHTAAASPSAFPLVAFAWADAASFDVPASLAVQQHYLIGYQLAIRSLRKTAVNVGQLIRFYLWIHMHLKT